MTNKIKYRSGSSSRFFQSLDGEVRQLLLDTDILQKSKKKLWAKMIVYSIIHIFSYVVLLGWQHDHFITLILSYVFTGLSGLLLAFNVSHDALHGTFSKNRDLNQWLYYLTFNLQGTNAYLWKVRHQSSHHIFPNVDGCDADIDDNPMIRLSPQHKLRNYQRYQHWYSVIVYCFYSIHWLMIKDVYYLYSKKVANLSNKRHSLKQQVMFFIWKAIYFSLIIVVPVLTGYGLPEVLLCFFIMHVVNSLVFIHFLIVTHLCMETQFPSQDEDGFLPLDYYAHQLATSLDYAPQSRMFNWLLGGFNAHAAHHLYPKLPHTIYPQLSVLIEKKAKEFDLVYNKLDLPSAIRSHYRYLKMMGKG